MPCPDQRDRGKRPGTWATWEKPSEPKGCPPVAEAAPHSLNPISSLLSRVRYHYVTGLQTLYVGRRDVSSPTPPRFSPSNLPSNLNLLPFFQLGEWESGDLQRARPGDEETGVSV